MKSRLKTDCAIGFGKKSTATIPALSLSLASYQRQKGFYTDEPKEEIQTLKSCSPISNEEPASHTA